MTKEEILNYVMDTPKNTNRMVLNDMLDEFSNSSSPAGGLVININEADSMDKTWKEIHDAFSTGQSVIASEVDGQFLYSIMGVYTRSDTYEVILASPNNDGYVMGIVFSTDSINGYPSVVD